ncbi:MAG: o-succinylbenzoate synthase [candidate division Zixibacteria bacterium]|nr:o-succinylbenzoate synthase [candidate division Zixibacteria bacterium]
MGGLEHKVREGALIRLTGEKETLTSWGEVAPLPGFSYESLGETKAQLLSLRAVVQDNPLPNTDELVQLNGAFEAWLGSYQLFPSVRFGIETAILRLLACERQVPLRSLISTKTTDKVLVCALLSGTNEEILEKAGMIRASGFKAVKLKIGRQDIEADVELVHNVRKQIGKRMALRLDANRAWKVEQATTFMDRVQDCNIEYIEEPAEDFLGILQLCNRASKSIPIALDESLGSITTLDPLPGVEAIVLKPTLLGLERSVQLARRAAELGMKAVMSSSFESGIGLHTLVELAAGLKEGPMVPVGLDTANSLAYDIAHIPLKIVRGRIDLTDKPVSNPQPRLELLEEVSDA